MEEVETEGERTAGKVVGGQAHTYLVTNKPLAASAKEMSPEIRNGMVRSRLAQVDRLVVAMCFAISCFVGAKGQGWCGIRDGRLRSRRKKRGRDSDGIGNANLPCTPAAFLVKRRQ